MTGWEKKMSDLSNPQKIILFVISVIFLVLVWNMIPIPTPLKIILYILITPLTLALVFFVLYVLEYIDLSDSFSKSLIPILIVFLVIPLSLNLVVLFRHDDYIASLPVPEKIDLLVSCDVDCIKDSGVGNEWVYSHEINGSRFKNNDVVNADIDNLLTFKTTITEYDDIDDVGEYSTTHSDNTGLYDYNYTKKVIHKVTVKECGGKRNHGASADFIVTYTIQRKPQNLFKSDIIPIEIQLAPVGFWTLLFFTDNIVETCIISYVLLSEILFFAMLSVESIREKQKNNDAYYYKSSKISYKLIRLLDRIIVILLIPIIIVVCLIFTPIYIIVLLIHKFIVWLKEILEINKIICQFEEQILEVEHKLKTLQEIKDKKRLQSLPAFKQKYEYDYISTMKALDFSFKRMKDSQNKCNERKIKRFIDISAEKKNKLIMLNDACKNAAVNYHLEKNKDKYIYSRNRSK